MLLVVFYPLNKHLRIQAENDNVGISQSFYKWLMQYGENAEILSPPDIRLAMVEQLNMVLEQYK